MAYVSKKKKIMRKVYLFIFERWIFYFARFFFSIFFTNTTFSVTFIDNFEVSLNFIL